MNKYLAKCEFVLSQFFCIIAIATQDKNNAKTMKLKFQLEENFTVSPEFT